MVEDCPEPSNIMWENIYTESSSRIVWLIFAAFILAVMLAGTMGLNFYIVQQKAKAGENYYEDFDCS